MLGQDVSQYSYSQYYKTILPITRCFGRSSKSVDGGTSHRMAITVETDMVARVWLLMVGW
jgi:hypothetical protein